MDESFLDDAIPSVLSKTIFQTFILMLVMRVAWSVVSFDRDTKIVSLKHLESSRSLHGWSFIPHIYYGYRYRRNSFAYCLLSTGCLHNETCNIWTHVFASLYFFNCFLSHDPSSTSKFVALAACYLFTVSSVAHSCSCHSEYVEKCVVSCGSCVDRIVFFSVCPCRRLPALCIESWRTDVFSNLWSVCGLGWDNKRFHDVFWRQICKAH